MQAACVKYNGQGAVYSSDHLGQAARLKRGGHENKITGCKGLVGQMFVEPPDTDSLVQAMEIDNVVEVSLICPVCHGYNLNACIPVSGNNIIQGFCQKRTSLLYRIQAGGPEKHRRLGISFKAHGFLEKNFILFFLGTVVFGSVIELDHMIHGWIEFGLRRI